MKHILKAMLLPVLALPLMLASCDTDTDSNPVLDLSHAADGFVLNVPSDAQNNTYDLVSAENIKLTCSMPNYGGVPYVPRFYVQVAIDGNFVNDPENTPYKELVSTSTQTTLSIPASEVNDAIVTLYQEANPDTDYPNTPCPVYVRLRAILDATQTGECFSNVITLPSVLATYVVPPATLPEQLFVCGSSIQEPWKSWKPVMPVYGITGQYFTLVYIPAGGEFKWGTFNEDWRGFDRLFSIDDKAGAGVSEGDESNIKFANGGWYVLNFSGEIVGNSVQYSLTIQPGKAYIIGAVLDPLVWTDADPNGEMIAPADATGQWVSPAFAGGGELRAYVKVPGYDWWRTEFTLYNGELFWRTMDIADNWAANVGSDYSVSCVAGQKLYVDFDNNTGEVK